MAELGDQGVRKISLPWVSLKKRTNMKQKELKIRAKIAKEVVTVIQCPWCWAVGSPEVYGKHVEIHIKS